MECPAEASKAQLIYTYLAGPRLRRMLNADSGPTHENGVHED